MHSVRKRLGDVEQKLARIVAELAAERIESARWKQRALQQQKTLQVRLSLVHTHILIGAPVWFMSGTIHGHQLLSGNIAHELC